MPLLFLRRSPWFIVVYSPLSPAFPSLPVLQPAVNANATTAVRATSSQPHIVLLYQASHVWSAHRFPPCFCVYSPSNDPTLGNEFMPISSSIPTLPKSCAAAFFSASFVFVTPKASSLPYDLWFVYPCSSGGWWCSSNSSSWWSWVRQWFVYLF